MKKKLVKIIGIVLLLLFVIQTVCFADVVWIDSNNTIHWSNNYDKPDPIEKNNNQGLPIKQIILLAFLFLILFFCLYIISKYLLDKNSNEKNVQSNSVEDENETNNKE